MVVGCGFGLWSEEAWRTPGSYLGGVLGGSTLLASLGLCWTGHASPMGDRGQPELQELPARKQEAQATLQLRQGRLWGLPVGRLLFWQPSRMPSSRSATPSLGPSGS